MFSVNDHVRKTTKVKIEPAMLEKELFYKQGRMRPTDKRTKYIIY